MTKLELPSPLVPSSTLMKSLVRIAPSYGAPILDAPCGFGRNALALAARGYHVVAVDRDIDRLRFIENSAANSFRFDRPSNACGRISSVCADLSTKRLPFAKSSFSAVICVHYPVQTIISDLDAAVQKGGHFYIETFGGQGQNYLELPKAGEIRDALAGYDFHFYKERQVGPPSQNSVTVRALGRKRL